MKRPYLFLATILFFAASCTQIDRHDIIVQKTAKGSIDLDQFPCTIEFEGTEITFKIRKEGSSDSIVTKAFGPMQYATTTMTQLTSKPEKTSVNYSSYQGIYMCNKFHFGNVITLPSNALFAEVIMPDPSPFKSLATCELGVNYNLSATSSGKKLDIWFYTMRVEYDMAGRQIGRVIPFDGNTVRVPYHVYYP